MTGLTVARGLGYRAVCMHPACGCVLPGVRFLRSEALFLLVAHDRIAHAA